MLLSSLCTFGDFCQFVQPLKILKYLHFLQALSHNLPNRMAIQSPPPIITLLEAFFPQAIFNRQFLQQFVAVNFAARIWPRKCVCEKFSVFFYTQFFIIELSV